MPVTMYHNPRCNTSRRTLALLRQRGVFRTEYTGRTLREHYGIPRPENVFTAARPEARADVA